MKTSKMLRIIGDFVAGPQQENFDNCAEKSQPLNFSGKVLANSISSQIFCKGL